MQGLCSRGSRRTEDRQDTARSESLGAPKGVGGASGSRRNAPSRKLNASSCRTGTADKGEFDECALTTGDVFVIAANVAKQMAAARKRCACRTQRASPRVAMVVRRA